MMTHFSLFFAALAFISMATATSLKAAEQPAKSKHRELGDVRWHRNFDKAMATAKKDKKPLLVLFQEVPGCQGCVQFGQETLKHPLIVDAIETSFTPLAIFNNQAGPGGHDQKILQRYGEPAWNYQVIRFLNHDGKDIIPRKDKVWTISGVAERMALSLEKSGIAVPKYLTTLYTPSAKLKTAAFAMHCFWDGEAKLGGLPGVSKTESGWLDGREVVKLAYDPNVISWEKLVKAADSHQCARQIYAPDAKTKSKTPSKYQGNTKLLSDSPYRTASDSDQKRHLLFSKLKSMPLNEIQKTKINAALSKQNHAEIWQWLSPRQVKRTMANLHAVNKSF